MRRTLSALLTWVALILMGGANQQPELPLVFREDFEKGANQWMPTDAKAWKIVERDGNKIYSQFRQSKFNPPHRSPLNLALHKSALVGDFVLEAKVRSTIKDYNHRDVCLFFGYQDPAHFYYVHLGKQTDDHANQIFIVDGADRVKISTKTTAGTPWDDNWHRVKVTRNVAEGKIAVYFDENKIPAMTAMDKKFAWGRVGIGSFDDTTDWDDLVLRGVTVEKR